MNKFLTLCLVAAGLAASSVSSATAHEVPVARPVTVTTAPSVVRVNATVVVRTGHRHHRRYRIVRRRYLRHGRYVVVTRRVYY